MFVLGCRSKTVLLFKGRFDASLPRISRVRNRIPVYQHATFLRARGRSVLGIPCKLSHIISNALGKFHSIQRVGYVLFRVPFVCVLLWVKLQRQDGGILSLHAGYVCLPVSIIADSEKPERVSQPLVCIVGIHEQTFHVVLVCNWFLQNLFHLFWSQVLQEGAVSGPCGKMQGHWIILSVGVGQDGMVTRHQNGQGFQAKASTVQREIISHGIGLFCPFKQQFQGLEVGRIYGQAGISTWKHDGIDGFESRPQFLHGSIEDQRSHSRTRRFDPFDIRRGDVRLVRFFAQRLRDDADDGTWVFVRSSQLCHVHAFRLCVPKHQQARAQSQV
mmetsp:Transcript_10836/g.66940  ORF Transcript_10836/g.66940 Transcript_10836/m.66940 type:complete len:330 (-) Transcript_10836:111-1100(-)